MDPLPIDTNHPSVRDFLSLVRLQVLTPLSLVINMATVLICATVVNPTISQVMKIHPTSITPNPYILGLYVLALYVGQIGYCTLLVAVTKVETKDALVKGVGLWLVFSNFVMAAWAITWVLQWFLVATILQGVLLLLLLYSNIALLIYHPPTSSRPFDTALIHAPLRFFFVLPFSILLPLSLFTTLGLTYTPEHPGAPPTHYSSWHAWIGFAVVSVTNVLGLVVIVLRRDVVWCIAAVWICISVWTQHPKPNPVYVTELGCTLLHPLGLLASVLYQKYSGSGSVSLPERDGDEEHPGLYRHYRGNRTQDLPAPREVEDGEVWAAHG
ncbi:hypothetical protein BDN72DRAFT_757465 [Pluteus cervinus]|uniref:Uncharacterized protein n=1 Tax=Pluteus cervinus TaxID=181527 RepID=A0ACD3BDD6_9AGAR|nr:hypothetical protein BDN72DRAFT_757465 [Pluteus cervinus]